VAVLILKNTKEKIGRSFPAFVFYATKKIKPIERKKNREKVNGYARKDYLKRKDKINARRRELYVPKKRTGKKPQPWKYVKTKWAPLDYRKVKDDTYKF